MWYARDSDEMPPVNLLYYYYSYSCTSAHFYKTQLDDLNHEIGFLFCLLFTSIFLSLPNSTNYFISSIFARLTHYVSFNNNNNKIVQYSLCLWLCAFMWKYSQSTWKYRSKVLHANLTSFGFWWFRLAYLIDCTDLMYTYRAMEISIYIHRHTHIHIQTLEIDVSMTKEHIMCDMCQNQIGCKSANLCESISMCAYVSFLENAIEMKWSERFP